jgi:hypothetical protein
MNTIRKASVLANALTWDMTKSAVNGSVCNPIDAAVREQVRWSEAALKRGRNLDFDMSHNDLEILMINAHDAFVSAMTAESGVA